MTTPPPYDDAHGAMSDSLQTYFRREAREHLEAIDEMLAEARLDTRRLERVARVLRGAARVAQAAPIAEVAGQLESVARALSEGRLASSPEVKSRVETTVDDLRRLVEAQDGDRDEETARAARARWDLLLGERAEGHADGEPGDALRSFIRAEIGGVVAAVDRALSEMERAPRRTEPLEAAVQRLRPLQGISGRPALTPVLEVLAGLEDFARQVLRGGLRPDLAPATFLRVVRNVLDAAGKAIDRGGELAEDSAELTRFREARVRFTAGGEKEVVPVADLYYERGPRLVSAVSAPVPGEASSDDVDRFIGERAGALLTQTLRAVASAGADAADEMIVETARKRMSALRDLLITYGRDSQAAAVAETLDRMRPGIATADLQGVVTHVGEAVRAEAPSAAGETPAREDAVQERKRTETGDGEVVPIETLLYRGGRALERALELQEDVLRKLASGDDAALRPLLEEVFDLVDLAREADAAAG